jgi:UDP-GlcNAc:undecaprenyl-phosphate/decaprenyl-phosphate GlcNAc-1-phosphate transferase
MKPIRAAAVAAAVGVAAHTSLRRRPPGGEQLWQRTNYRGRHPSLLAGPAVTFAAAAATLPTGAAAGLTLACGGLGLYDDLAGDSHARGLRGHLVALRQRRVTTGMVKLVGLVIAGAVTSLTERRRPTDVVVDTLLVAGTANLANLFDLRPGRALKVVVFAGFPLAVHGSVAAGAATGAALAVLPADLAEHAMIGDCGANALGALIGWAVAHGLDRRGRTAVLAAVIGLTLASERVSFTDVIAGNRWLAAVDGFGRRQ